MSTEIADMLVTAGWEGGAAESGLDRLGQKWDKTTGRMRDAQGRFTSMKGAADSATASIDKQGSSLDGFVSRLNKVESITKKMGTALTVGVTAPIAGAVAAIIGIGSTTETALNRLQGTSQATEEQMEKVRSKARELGKDLTLPNTSAKDAALAMLELNKGGLSVEQSMDAARGTIQLAKAALIEEQQAAVITADALNTFGLAGDQAVRVADLLAGSASASSGEVTDMAAALAQVGAVAKGAGLSIEDTATAVSLLAKNGIKGSDAGTSLKTFLLALQTPVSNDAAEALKKLNLEAYDSQGNLKPLPSIIGEFKTALSGLDSKSQASFLKEVFGSDAIRAARILFGEGTEGFEKMSAAITRSGQAQEQAAAATKGLAGAWGGFLSILETAANDIFEDFKGPLTEVVGYLTEGATYLSDLWNSLTPGGKQAIAVIAGIAAAIGPLLLAISGIVGAVALIAPIAATVAATVAWVLGIGAAIAGVAIAWKNNWGGMREVVAAVWDAIKSIFTSGVALVQNIYQRLVAFWDSNSTLLVNIVSGAWDAIKNNFLAALTVIKDVFNIIVGVITGDWQKAWDAVVDLASNVPVYIAKALWGILKVIANLAVLVLKSALELGWAIIKGILEALVALPGKVWDALMALPGLLKDLAVWIWDKAVAVGKAIVEAIWEGIRSLWSWLTDGLGSAMETALQEAGLRAKTSAYNQGAAAGTNWSAGFRDNARAYTDPGTRAVEGGGYGNGSSWGPPETTAPAGATTPAGDPAKKRSMTFGGAGGGGRGGGGGKSAAEMAAEAATKSAEIQLRAVERINNEAARSLSSLFERNRVALEVYVKDQLAQEEKLYQARVAVNTRQQAEAALIKNKTERNTRVKELNEDLLQLESDHRLKVKEIQDAGDAERIKTLDARLDAMFRMESGKLRAQTDLVNSAQSQRVLSAKATAAILGQIQLNELNVEEERVRGQLALMKEGSEGYKRLYLELGVLEVQRGLLMEKVNRDVAEGRRRDLEDLKNAQEETRRLQLDNLDFAVSIGRDKIEDMRRHNASARTILRAEIQNQLAAENIRHRAAQEDIKKLRRELEEKRKLGEEYLKQKALINEREALEDERHRREQERIREQEMDRLREKLKTAADKITGILTKAVDEGVKGGFKAAFRSILADFAQLLRDMAVALMKSALLKILEKIFGIGSQGQGQGQGSGGGGGWLGSIGSILRGVLGGGGGSQQQSGGVDLSGVPLGNDGGANGEGSWEIWKNIGEDITGAIYDTSSEAQSQRDKIGSEQGARLDISNQQGAHANNSLSGIKADSAVIAINAAIQTAIMVQALVKSWLDSAAGAAGATMATGGFVSGAGTGTSDSIHAMLSNGEFVINAAAVQHYGRDLFDQYNQMSKPARYATGGFVALPSILSGTLTAGAQSARDGGAASVHHHHHTWNIRTPDDKAFRRSLPQIAREMDEQGLRASRRF